MDTITLQVMDKVKFFNEIAKSKGWTPKIKKIDNLKSSHPDEVKGQAFVDGLLPNQKFVRADKVNDGIVVEYTEEAEIDNATEEVFATDEINKEIMEIYKKAFISNMIKVKQDELQEVTEAANKMAEELI